VKPSLVLVLLAALALPAGARQESAARERAAALCAQLGDPARAEAAFTELLGLGPVAAEVALEDLASVDLAGRRARSLLVREVGREAAIAPALERLGDRDAEVREHLLAFLALPELRASSAPERAAALERVAREDPEERLRSAALETLGRIDHASAAASLERLMDTLGPPFRAQAARALASLPAAREIVVERVQASFEVGRGAAPLALDALAVLFGPAYGLRLAEVPAGGSRPSDLVPFVLGARHPSAEVRAGASLALERFVARSRFLGEVPRAEALLAALLGRGLDDGDLLEQRARLALAAGEDPGVALDAARALGALTDSADSNEALRRRGAAGLLEAAALLALERPDEAAVALDAAERATAAVVARRLDRLAPHQVAVQVGLLERLALVELYRALARLWTAPDPTQPAVLARARAAHTLSLRAQVVITREWPRVAADASRPPPWGLDSLVEDDLSPWRLLFSNPAQAPGLAARALELQRQLLTALASVAPLEVPGFAPVESTDPTVGDPRDDPERQRLLSAQLRAYEEALTVLATSDGDGGPDEDARARAERRMLLLREAELVARERSRDEGKSWRVHLRQRLPTDVGLALAEELRAEGRTEASRALSQRLLDDLEAAGEFLSQAWGEELIARAEVTLGAAWMDDDDPDKADALYLSALERLEVLERELADRGVSEAGLRRLRLRRADVLVSLAVNANVKRRAHDLAVDYFERAYELREDDFMRVLLACYRARVGRDAEARAVLRDLPVSPSNYYNLACTYALLGERELALDFLRRDFAEMRSSPGQLERQKQWARGDPDLESLQGDPRFETLVAPAEAEEPR
jgi:hypothetical protein